MSVRYVAIAGDSVGQRIDNFLIKTLKGVPKSRLYRALRKGEVRVNKKRVRATYRLQLNDMVRIPPVTTTQPVSVSAPSDRFAQALLAAVLFENDDCLVINKPSGLAVHGGSGVSAGLIELLRLIKKDEPYLELVHRLDKSTSGCLLIAKNRGFLLHCHQMLLNFSVNKQYIALVNGAWHGGDREVSAPLLKFVQQGGEHSVVVDEQGKSSKTRFQPLQRFKDATLISAFPVTGRTHQIRVHAAYIGHEIAHDEKYGNKQFNRYIKTLGLKRLFLHASQLSLPGYRGGPELIVDAPLPEALLRLIDKLN